MVARKSTTTRQNVSIRTKLAKGAVFRLQILGHAHDEKIASAIQHVTAPEGKKMVLFWMAAPKLDHVTEKTDRAAITSKSRATFGQEI